MGMLTVLECENCGYARTNQEDGEQFHEVCSICYAEECPTNVGYALICHQCFEDEKRNVIEHPDPKG